MLILHYKGKAGKTTLKSLRNTLKSVMPANNLCKIIYPATKLVSKLNIKDKIRKEHKHDPIFKAQCPDLNCDETYIGEIGDFQNALQTTLIVMIIHTYMNMQKRLAMKMRT